MILLESGFFGDNQMDPFVSSKVKYSEVLSVASKISGIHWLVLMLAIVFRELLAIVCSGIVLMLLIESPEVALLCSVFVRVSVHLLLQPCIIRLILELCRADKIPPIKKLFSNWKLHVCFLFNALIFFVLELIGLGICLIPGILLFTLFAFWGVAMIDQGILSPKRAFAESYRLARGNLWTILLVTISAAIFGLIPGMNLFAECLLCIWLSFLYLRLVDDNPKAGDSIGSKEVPFSMDSRDCFSIIDKLIYSHCNIETICRS